MVCECVKSDSVGTLGSWCCDSLEAHVPSLIFSGGLAVVCMSFQSELKKQTSCQAPLCNVVPGQAERE